MVRLFKVHRLFKKNSKLETSVNKIIYKNNSRKKYKSLSKHSKKNSLNNKKRNKRYWQHKIKINKGKINKKSNIQSYN